MDAPPQSAQPVEPDPDQLTLFDVGDLVSELIQAIKDIGGVVR